MRSDHYRFGKQYNDKFLIINLLFKFLFSILKGGFLEKIFTDIKIVKNHITKEIDKA